jgi:hypothetical protein
MFNSPILDIAIVLCFTYFMLSLIVTSLNEILLTKMALRGKLLKEAIMNLYFDDGWKFKVKEILDSPHITSLQRHKGRDNSFPSYIPSVNFISAIIDCLRSEAKTKQKLPSNGLLDMNTIREVITDESNGLPKEFRISMIAMVERAAGDFQKFQSEIEGFYNNMMDRVTGWYKRHANNWIFVISFVIVAASNVDSIYIIKTLWNADPEKLKTMTDKISESVNNHSIIMQDSLNVKETVEVYKTLSGMMIPMGWNTQYTNSKYVNNDCTPGGWIINAIITLFGWIMTSLALMLGAPFWFDILNKFVNIRGAGKKPDDSKPAGDKYLNQSRLSSSDSAVG